MCVRQTPIITIITVVYNGEKALPSTIESIIPHLNREVKYIIIDGGSSDSTPEIIQSYASHLSYWVSEPDKGIYDAMNKGWRAADDSSYILYIGAGDRMISLPQKSELLDRQGNLLPIIMGRCEIGDKYQFHSRWGNEIRLRNTAHHQALMICKSLAKDAPFDLNLKVYADWEFNLRLFLRGLRAIYLDSLSSYAEPGGVSWGYDLAEIRTVARRHGGPLLGQVAWWLNWASLRRRDYLDKKGATP